MKGNIPIQIIASDINESNIYKARAGIYPESIKSDISPTRLQRYFNKVDDGYQICRLVRDTCVFAKHDLTRDIPFSRLDFISCRNLLIYLEPVLQKRIISLFHYALNPGGVLILGRSETLSSVPALFRNVDKKNKFYVKIPAKVQLNYNFSNSNYQTQTQNIDSYNRTANRDINARLGKEADQLILAKYNPPGVIIDDDLKIVQFRGHTSAYLEPAAGAASFNLLKMAHSSLLLPLRRLIHKVKKTKLSARIEGVRIDNDRQLTYINIEVAPINVSPLNRLYFLVLFENVNKATLSKPTTSADNKRGINKRQTKDSQIRELTQELAATKEYLQSVLHDEENINDELRFTSEEIQANNEELQSTNEELETTKEELQSTNEELTTLNDELQNRNLELAQLNNDLNNLLSSVNIPIIMFSQALHIRWFTAAAEQVLKVRQTDIGRKIDALTFNFNIADLPAKMLKVMATLAISDQEIQDQQGHWYSLQLHPYQTSDNKIEGVIMLLLDIDVLKRNLELITVARNYAESIVETVREPLLVLDTDLCIKTTNQAFGRFFQLTRAETLGQTIFQLDNGGWAIEALRVALSERSEKNDQHDILIEREFPRIGKKILLLNICQFFQFDKSERLLLLAFEDITERQLKQEEQARQLIQEKIYKEVFRAQEVERARIARELHDEFGQAITTIMIEFELILSGQKLVPGNKPHLDKIKQVIKHTALEIQRITADLRPTLLDDFGLVAALRSLGNSFTESSGIRVELNISENIGRIPAELELVLYRVAQEGLTNIAKHAQATRVVIKFYRYQSIIELIITDNGSGFDSNIILTKDDHGKIGLRGMRERLRIFGGKLNIISKPGNGSELQAQIQLPTL